MISCLIEEGKRLKYNVKKKSYKNNIWWCALLYFHNNCDAKNTCQKKGDGHNLWLQFTELKENNSHLSHKVGCKDKEVVLRTLIIQAC